MRLLCGARTESVQAPDRILVRGGIFPPVPRRPAARRGCGTCACPRQCDGL